MKFQQISLCALLALFLAGCSSVPAGSVRPDGAAPAAEMTTRERVQLAVQLLDKGEEARAITELEIVLEESPGHSSAISLRNQVKTDPRKMLGASFKTYTVQPGDTLSSLARTYLGDAMLFYALSQYNELPAPNRVMVGQTLKIPDKFSGAPNVAGKAPAASKPAETVAKASSADVEAARSLRLEALEHLNKGNANQAVALLEKAAGLDSASQSISADLARAQRIQQTLRKTD